MAKQSKKGHRSPKRSKKETTAKPKYKVRNWHEYNEALVNRGRLTLWIDPDTQERWYILPPPSKRKRGGQEHYSDYAITTTLQIGHLFGQPLRQTEGLVRDFFAMLGSGLQVPDFTTLCRREDRLPIQFSKRALTDGPIDIILDATGLKVYGEGEWKVRQHGWSRHRTWRKLHLAITFDGEIHAMALSGNNTTDGKMAPDLLEQISAPIASATGDGGYDKRDVYDPLIERKVATIIIPPQKNADIWYHGNRKGPKHPRDQIVRTVRRIGRKRWKQESGYSGRSKIEATMFRFKTIFGDHLQAHLLHHQQVEAAIKVDALNKMMALGMPQSYRVQ